MQTKPARKFSDAEIDLLVKQAGERERVSIQQMNTQIDAKILDKPIVSEGRAVVLVRHAEERARMEITQSNERLVLEERFTQERAEIVKRHAQELEKI